MATQIDTGTTELLAEVDEGVLTLTMNRPEARNAMTGTMTTALAATLAGAELDPAVRCIVLTGSGGAFSGGGDVKAMAASGDGTVGADSIDGAIHRQRVNQQRRPESCSPCPSRRLPRCPARPQGVAWRWRWPATCASWRARRS